MQAFEYSNPASVREAVGLLGARWGEVTVLAGGTDLLSLMKEHLETPRRLVNIKNIKEIGGIVKHGAEVRIGATVTLDELERNPDIRRSFPVLALAGSLAGKKKAPASAGTFPTHGPLFVGLLLGVIAILYLLQYFPALALGPIVEHFLMLNGKAF